MQLETDGLVIAEQSIGESDRLVTVLTRDEGIVRAFARQAKKSGSTKVSATQLFCYSRFTIYKGREKYIIDDARPAELFFDLRRDIECLALAQYFCQLAVELVPEGVESADFLRLVLNALHFLCRGTRPQAVLKAIVELRMLSEAGYGLTARILDASRCGVPQARKRFILVGHLGAENGFLDEALEAGLAEKQLTVRDYLGDKLGTQYYYMHPRSYARRGVFSVDEPSATIRGINRPIPENYRRHHGDAAAIEDGVRALTAKERSYLQSFPESFKFEGAKTSVELAIGNAVPPALAKYVATCIVEYEDKLEE